jgi:membrane protein
MSTPISLADPPPAEDQDWRAKLAREADSSDVAADLARAREPGRGREAVDPTEFPSRGWLDILWRVVLSIPQDRILATAGSVAFFALLAIFPAMAVIVSLYGLAFDVRTIGDHLAILAGILPAGALDLIRDQIIAIVTKQTQTLSIAFAIGFLTALWSANSGMGALFDALNVVYGEREKRSILRFYATTFLFTVGGIVFIVAAFGAVVVLPVVLKFVGISFSAEIILSVVRWPILLVVVIAGLAAVYRFGPSRATAQWRWVTLGSVAAAVLWIVASMGFSWYVASFDSYNRTYGSLGAGVGFMVWIWVSVIVVLVGGELNAEMEHQTARDTTTGPAEPLGQRGATMADRVGKAQA